MSLKLQIKFGSSTVMVEADDVRDLAKEASFFNELPCQCNHCKSSNLGFKHRNVQENDYYEFVCRDCGHYLKLGVLKKGGLYPNFKEGWQAPFVGGNNNND